MDKDETEMLNDVAMIGPVTVERSGPTSTVGEIAVVLNHGATGRERMDITLTASEAKKLIDALKSALSQAK